MSPEELVAFKGEVEVVDAAWSLDKGRTVSLRLCGEAFDRNHPFKKFQKRRNGHVGTRFKGVFANTKTGELWQELELMLADWKDSSFMGQVTTFWLDDDPAIHPFAYCQRRKGDQIGEIFALVLVELNDDDTPINQAQRERAEAAAGAVAGDVHPAGPDQEARGPDPGPRGATGGRAGAAARGGSARPRKLSSSVHLLCTSGRYVRWLRETKPNVVKEWTPEIARIYTKKLLEVESLSELDRNPQAAQRYETLIRKPYDRWLHQEP